MRVQLLWTDGSLTDERSWEMAEWRVRQAQWRPYKTRLGFRLAMRRRVRVWSGGTVPLHGTSEEFLRALERGGLVRVQVLDQEDVR